MEALYKKWQYFWGLHVMGAVGFSRLFFQLLKNSDGEGVILNTAFICAKQPLYYEPIYLITKAAIVMLSKCLAEELIKIILE